MSAMRLALGWVTVVLTAAGCDGSDQSEAAPERATAGSSATVGGNTYSGIGGASRASLGGGTQLESRPGTGGANAASSGGSAKGYGGTENGTDAIGGTNASGGRSDSTASGSTSQGGTTASGSTNQGGTTARGGSANQGGTTTRGGSTNRGGTTTRGGSSNAGGTTTRGGSTNAGGATSSGGAVSYTGTLPANPQGGEDTTLTIGGEQRTVRVYRPSTAGAGAPLLILFHGTGGDQTAFMRDSGVMPLADSQNFVVITPKANRPQQGPADVDHWESVQYDSGWNLGDTNPATNDDVLLTRAIIDAASKAYGINRKQVYTAGMSNGGFFAPMVALLLPNEIAAFAEHSGGAIRCANRGKNGEQFRASGTSCATIATETGYPACTGEPLKPFAVPTTGRVPYGYLFHGNADQIVSVAWTCHLADAMGANATTKIIALDYHGYIESFLPDAWAVISKIALP